MRLLSRAAVCLLLASLAVAAGCRQRVEVAKTVSVDAGDIKATIIDAPARDQQVTVTVSSPGAAVSAYLVLEKDRPALEDALRNGKKPAKALAEKERAEQATLEATVPAGNEYAVVLSGASKATQVQLTIKGR